MTDISINEEFITSVVLAIVTAITAILQRRISDKSWQKSVLDDLRVYDELVKRASNNDEAETANAIKDRAFRTARAKVLAPAERKDGLVRTVSVIAKNTVATQLALAESFVIVAIVWLASGQFAIPFVCYTTLLFGAFVDVMLFVSAKREHGKSYR